MTALQTLTTDELLRHVHASFDPLTTTELEREVAARLQTLVDEASELEPLRSALDDHDLEPADLVALYELLDKHNATELKTLREKLERADKWFLLAEEAGDLFQQLRDLAATTL